MPAQLPLSVASPISVVPQAPPNKELDGISLLNDIDAVAAASHNNKGLLVEDRPWLCPASAKSLRTTNPIRAIVDPIVANIKSGNERGDGKDLISLAVS